MEGPIQSLPDELLLEIFGRITDAETLLDGVALVCRRWSVLAREAEAWASVELTVERPTAVTDQDRRCLLRAPALRTLKLDSDNWPALLPTLHRSRVEVTGTLAIRFVGSPHDRRDARRAALALLWRSRGRLRELMLHSWYEHPCVSADGAEGRSLIAVLAAMSELQRLDLSLPQWPDLYPAACASSPVVCLPPPQLRELQVMYNNWEFIPGCLLTLLRGAAPNLRWLSLNRPWLGSVTDLVELEAALGLCVGLRHMVTQRKLPPLSALTAWTALESLVVSQVEFCNEEELSQLDHFLQCCALIGSLRTLVVRCNVVGVNLERCRQFVDAFRQARSAVRVIFVAFTGSSTEYL